MVEEGHHRKEEDRLICLRRKEKNDYQDLMNCTCEESLVDGGVGGDVNEKIFYVEKGKHLLLKFTFVISQFFVFALGPSSFLMVSLQL